MPEVVEGKERKPTIVLVHDAHHGPEHFTRLTSALQDAGYKVRAPALPSSHKPKRAAKDLAPDIDAVQAAVEDEISMHNDTVVLAHGYGGVPASCGIRRLDKVSKARQHNKAGVARLVYLAALLPDKDQPLLERWPGAAAEADAHAKGELKVEGGFYTPEREAMGERFYNHQKPEDVEWAAGLIKPWAVAVAKDTMKWEPWKWEVPCTYICCTDDNAMSSELQESMFKGRGMDVVKLEADHSPFIDQPESLAKIIRKYAGEHDVEIGEVIKS